MGQRQHDVPAQLGEPGLPGGAQRGGGSGGGVGTPKAAQLVVPGALHAQAQPVHPGLSEPCQPFRRHHIRIGLQRDLRPRQRVCRRQQSAHLRRGEQPRCAAAEIHGVRPPVTVCKFPQKRVHIVLRHRPAARRGIKIAVAAFGRAVRNVNIQSKS